MADAQIEMLDEVMTEQGKGLVVGFPEFDQVEVRFTQRGGLLTVVPLSSVKKITAEDPEPETPEATPNPAATLSYEEARAAGLSPTLDPALATDLNQPTAPPKRSTLAGMVAAGDTVPRGASGKPLSGAALQRYLAKQARES